MDQPEQTSYSPHNLLALAWLSLKSVTDEAQVDTFAAVKREWLAQALKPSGTLPSDATLDQILAVINGSALSNFMRRQCTAKLTQSFEARTASSFSKDLAAEGYPDFVVAMRDGRVCFEPGSTGGTISDLLPFLDLKGALVCIEGSACAHETATQIVNAGGDYLAEVPAQDRESGGELHEARGGEVRYSSQRRPAWPKFGMIVNAGGTFYVTSRLMDPQLAREALHGSRGIEDNKRWRLTVTTGCGACSGAEEKRSALYHVARSAQRSGYANWLRSCWRIRGWPLRATICLLDWQPRAACGHLKPRMGVKTICCAVAAIVIGFLAPLVCASYDGVITEKQVRAKICASDEASLEVARQSLCGASSKDNASAEITHDELETETAKQEKRTAATKASDKPIMVGFFPGLSTAAWPLAFLVLSVALLWYTPKRDPVRIARPGRFWAWTWATLASLMVGANYARELAPNWEEGRRVFSHTNHDIAPASAHAYNALFVILAGLISLIWTRWLSAHRSAPEASDKVQEALGTQQTELLSQAFEDWQHASVLVVAAFIPGAFLYWQVVHKHNDLRYVFSAGIYHIVFALTWYFVSLPLLDRWGSWHKTRAQALAVLAFALWNARTGDEQERKAASERLTGIAAAIKEIQPVPKYTLIAAAVVTMATVLAPLYQLAH